MKLTLIYLTISGKDDIIKNHRFINLEDDSRRNAAQNAAFFLDIFL